MPLSEVTRAFGQAARDYDRWFEGNPLFESELRAVRALGPLPRPALEVGVGTGRFARALGVEFGLDPCAEMLALARGRGVRAVRARAEALPFAGEIFGAVLLLFTLCFVEDPAGALREAGRVLRPGGTLVVGIINRDSALGRRYQEKARQGHPLYRLARFLSLRELEALAQGAGFAREEACSLLLEGPGGEEPRPGAVEGAGFVVSRWRKGP